MVTQNKKLEQIYDLFAVRIIVETERDCYTALGVIHEIYKPIPGHFKDYIAMPKPNNYQITLNKLKNSLLSDMSRCHSRIRRSHANFSSSLSAVLRIILIGSKK